jgi:hypothetical protein
MISIYETLNLPSLVSSLRLLPGVGTDIHFPVIVLLDPLQCFQKKDEESIEFKKDLVSDL